MMLYICVGVTGAGFACYFMAMEATSPITASLVFFFKPALAPVLALFFCRKPFR
ncbi:MAG: EamA family transporter [Bilophila wadsworthia]